MDNRTRKIHFLVEAGLIGALYAVLTYVSSMMGLAYGEVQFRISEALTILPVFTPAAIQGLVIGCIIANIGSPFGMVDIVCGSLATLAAAGFSYAVRKCSIKDVPWLGRTGACQRGDRGAGDCVVSAGRSDVGRLRGLRGIGRFGRAGDLFWTRPAVGGAAGTHGPCPQNESDIVT